MIAQAATTTMIPWPEIITGIVSLFMGGTAFVSATRANRSTTQIETIKVDAEAFARAQNINDQIIEQLRKDNARLTEMVERLERKIEKLETAINAQSAAIHDQSDAIQDQSAAIREQGTNGGH